MIITGYPEFVAGYIEQAHYELEIDTPEEQEEFKTMSLEEKIQYLLDNGELIIDDFEVNDIGRMKELNIV